MKKRIKLKSWVENVLVVIFVISFISLASDCSNMINFIISHIISLATFLSSAYLLYKYTNFFEI